MGTRATDRLQRMLNNLEIEEHGSAAAVEQPDTQAGYDVTPPSEVESEPAASPDRPSKMKELEDKVMQLLQENNKLKAVHDQQLKRKDLENQELQKHVLNMVRELQMRQQQVESSAPLVKMQLDELRAQLQDLRISDAQYRELKRLPAERTTLMDMVRVAVHESCEQLSTEGESLRLALVAARETASRAEQDRTRHKLEVARLEATVAEKEKDVHILRDNLQARIDRLATELEALQVHNEVLTAKGQMYDELAAKCSKLEEENSRLQVAEATFKRAEKQMQEREFYVRDKEHQVETLLMDKAYLTKQAEVVAEEVKVLQAELAERKQKIAELSRSNQHLYEKLAGAERAQQSSDAERLAQQLAALQASTAKDIDRIRTETAQAYEREARLLRELREDALAEADRAKAALVQARDEADRAAIAHAATQKQLEAQAAALQGDLRQKDFELSHVKVVLGEKEDLMVRGQMQVDLLNAKLAAVMDKYRALQAAAAAASGAAAAAGGGGALALAAPAGAAGLQQQQRRALPLLAEGAPEREELLASVAETKELLYAEQAQKLVVEKAVLTQLVSQLKAQVADLQGKLVAAEESIRSARQPAAYMMQQVSGQRAEIAALQAALEAKEQELLRAAGERDVARRDVESLLAQRGQLEGVKQMVMQAMEPEPSAGLGRHHRPALTATVGRTGLASTATAAMMGSARPRNVSLRRPAAGS